MKKMFKITKKKIVDVFFFFFKFTINREFTVLETLLYLPDQLICHRKKSFRLQKNSFVDIFKR